MNQKANKKWIVDLKKMTCRNAENNLVIHFERKGRALSGKIIDLPLDLIHKWADDSNGKSNLKKAIIEADAVFFKEYFNREITEKRIGA